MARFKLTTKYYIKIHDKNLPGDDGWKVPFEMESADFYPYVPYWCDKFIVYEKILQEVINDNGEYTCVLSDFNINESTYNVVYKDNKYIFEKEKDEEDQIEK